MTPREAKHETARAELEFGRYAGLGLRFAVTVALFGLLGWWIDGRVGWSPWLLVTGVLLGAVVAFIGIVRAVPPPQNLHLEAKLDDDDPV